MKEAEKCRFFVALCCFIVMFDFLYEQNSRFMGDVKRQRHQRFVVNDTSAKQRATDVQNAHAKWMLKANRLYQIYRHCTFSRNALRNAIEKKTHSHSHSHLSIVHIADGPAQGARMLLQFSVLSISVTHKHTQSMNEFTKDLNARMRNRENWRRRRRWWQQWCDHGLIRNCCDSVSCLVLPWLQTPNQSRWKNQHIEKKMTNCWNEHTNNYLLFFF